MEYKGISAHAGQVRAKVCIVHNTDEFEHCQEGDIALLVKVKPSTGLIKKVSALLAVHGGITSHAAIAARESNKPAIVGLPEEMLENVKDGDEVEVDAKNGIVKITSST